MDAETYVTTIEALKRRAPFRPFTVSLINGDRFEVDHPEALAGRGGSGVFFGPGGVMVIFDHEGVAQITDDLMHSEGSR